MSTESENVFRQLFRNWNDRSNRTTTSSTSNRPVLSEWTDYFKTGANDLYNRLPSSVQDIGATNNNVQEPSWYNLSRLEINWFWVLSWSICVMLCVVLLHVAGFGIKTKKIWFVMDWRICTFCCIIWCFTGAI